MTRATPEQIAQWLRYRMDELGFETFEELAQVCGSDKANISRIFR
jgi:DNA-binding MurR/RpiR family transcriptional regulator